MKALIFGKTGQVATELARLAPAHDVTATLLGREAADLARPGACAAHIEETDADCVINAAAYTAVDKAESEEPLALRINGEAPGEMARACAARGLPFLHVSTDYVFDGTGDAPWTTADATAPIGAYGRTKLAGEIQVAQAGGWYAILRTSWVFSAHGGNFVKTMLRLSESRDRLTIVADQIGGPTPAAAIADALLRMACAAPAAEGGVYHFSGTPDTSWAGFAREIFRQARRDVTVEDIPTTDYPTPAARPLNSRLDCSRLESVFGIGRPDWREGLAEVLVTLGARAGD